MPHVLVVGRLHASGLALLQAEPDLTWQQLDATTEDDYAALMPGADALVIRTQPLTQAAIARAPRLAIVSRHGVGYDSVDVAALDRRRIPLCVVGDVNTVAVAEHAMMMILASIKQALRADRSVRMPGRWDWRLGTEAREIGGRRLLLVGYGRIGQRVGELARAFGMTVAAHDPYLPAASWPGPAEREADLMAALARADVVSLHMPGGTTILGAAQIAAMKPGGVIVNTARGGLVDEAALASALAAGHLAAAGLDVFQSEPPAQDHPLYALDQVLLSPHIAGLTAEGGQRLSVHSVQNVIDFYRGRLDPALVVNRAAIGWTTEGRA